MQRCRVRRGGLAAALLVALVSLGPGRSVAAAQVAPLTVCPSDCPYTSVQAAIDAAASGATIAIAPGVYPAQLTVSGKRLTLQGAGSEVTALDGEQAGRVLVVEWDAAVTLRALTVRNGRAVGPSFPAGAGGGIFIATGGTLTISRSTITDNTAGAPGDGGIANAGTLTISESAIRGNRAEGSGGGLYNSRRLRIDASSISGNHSQRSGGGIYTTDRLSVARSQISANRAGVGGGLFNDGTVGDAGIVELDRVVLQDNAATADGGGLANAAGGTLAVSRSTLTGNRAGGRGAASTRTATAPSPRRG